MEKPWTYVDNKHEIVFRIHADGCMESCLATTDEIIKYIADGNIILENFDGNYSS